MLLRMVMVFGIVAWSVAPAAAALLGTAPDTSELIQIDPNTGAGTVIGSTGFGIIDGLAFDPLTGTLYGSDSTNFLLLTLDPATGARTVIGSLGDPVFGLAFDPNTNTLYGSNVGTGDLIIIDPATAATVSVGAMGANVSGLAFDPNGNILYGTDGAQLLTLDTATGAATLVGLLNNFGAEGLAFDPFTNTLYGVGPDITQAVLFTIDPNTAVETVIGPTGFFGVFGMDYTYAIPEPSSFALVGIGAAGAMGIGIRRRLRRSLPRTAMAAK